MPIDAGSDPRSGIPATPAIAVALRALLSDPGLTAKLEGMEACGDRQCYHVTLTIAPDLTWRAINGALIGAPPGGELGPVDPAVPEITLDVLVDEATRQLVSLSTSVAVQGQSVDLTATLSDHGVEFDLVPPPPDQVVESNVGGGTAPPLPRWRPASSSTRSATSSSLRRRRPSRSRRVQRCTRVAGRGPGRLLDSPPICPIPPWRPLSMTDDRERWALILGASSGMGEATALALARAGYRICGIHLDFRAGLQHVEEVKAGIEAAGSEAIYINMNAADDEKRASALATLRERFDRSEAEGKHPYVRVVMHSLAFGSLVPFISDDPKAAVDRKKMEMTQDVMANSLVYWVQDLYRGGFLERGSKVYAMTSEGSARVVPSYGVVSSAKAALESHVRQLAMEMARLDTGIAVNALQAGVTDTPALRKIPEAARMVEITLARNAHGRLTTTQDVADAIVTLSSTDSDWVSGNIIRADGAEFVTG